MPFLSWLVDPVIMVDSMAGPLVHHQVSSSLILCSFVFF